MYLGNKYSINSYNRGIYLILTVFGILFSCSNDSSTKQESIITEQESIINEYLENLRNYPYELTKHFPNEINFKSNYGIHYTYASKYSPSKLYLTQKENGEHIDSLVTISRKLSDTDSLLIVNKYARLDNLLSLPYQEALYEVQQDFGDSIVIPNFYDSKQFLDTTFHHLKDDFTVYLIEAKPNICCDEKLHNRSWHMPEKWKDGFSRGIAINHKENIVMYWIVVW